MIKAFVAVRDTLTRLGLQVVIDAAEDCSVVGSTADLEEIRKAVRDSRPDIVILDVAFRRADPTLVPELASDPISSRVLVVVEHGADECALRYVLADRESPPLSESAVRVLDECCLTSLRTQASGCLPKGADSEQVLRAVRTVAEGEIAAAPWLAALIERKRRPRPGTQRAPTPITPRELEVMTLVAEGMGNKEVAHALNIREQTVKNHLVRIMAKLGVSNRLEVGLYSAHHHFDVLEDDESRGFGPEG